MELKAEDKYTRQSNGDVHTAAPHLNNASIKDSNRVSLCDVGMLQP